MKKVSAAIENSVVNELKNGESYRKIAKKHQISFALVQKIRKRNDIPVNNNRGGGTKKITTGDQRILSRLILTGRAKTARAANKEMRETYNVDVSVRTTQRELRRIGFKALRKVKKPLLNERHRKLRLNFAKEHKDWTEADWDKVVWTDESKVNMFGSDGIAFTWKKPNSALTDRDVIPTKKFGGGKILFWGCFNTRGVGNLCKIDGIMNADCYIDILKSSYFSSLKKFKLGVRSSWFQQDNDPKHTARKTINFLKTKKLKIMEWPPQSPDLNPIENLWGILKRRLNNYAEPPKTKDELWERAQDIWESIAAEECKKLVRSMPERLSQVISAKGGYTKY